MNNKPKLTPPEPRPPETPRSFSPDPSALRMKVVASLVFFVLVVAAIAVVAVLPDRLAKKREHLANATENGMIAKQVAAVPVARQQPETIPEALPEEEEKSEAELLLKEVLKRQAVLEAEGVKVWGSRTHVTSYPEVLAKLSEADAHFKAQQYGRSVNAYKETIDLLQQLDSSRPERIRSGLQAGLEALDRLDDNTAIREFETVLALDPGNTESIQGLERARQVPRITALVEKGQIAERQDDLDQAQAAYKGAVSLDSKFKPAREHLERVDELIRTRQFNGAVAEAELALERGNFTGTQNALRRARQLQPDASEVRNIARRLHSRKRQAELKRIRKLAIAQEKKENWNEARQSYEKALAIDANATFASNGKRRTDQYGALNKAVNGYLAEPQGLQQSETRAKAREILQAVANLDSGQRLHQKNNELGRLIDAYEKPVAVTLHSDGITEVTLYRVGKLGRFQVHRRQLRPGLYTAQGTRSGYRDVKVTFEVPINGVQTTVSIVCQEAI